MTAVLQRRRDGATVAATALLRDAVARFALGRGCRARLCVGGTVRAGTVALPDDRAAVVASCAAVTPRKSSALSCPL